MDANNCGEKVEPGDNVAEHHSRKQSSLVCKVCKQMFKHHSSHSRHQSTCGQKKPFYCKRCAKPFRRKDSLNRHFESCQHKVLKTFQCYMCGREFNDNWQLQRHLKKKRSCSIISSIESPDCVKNFEEHGALANHVPVAGPNVSPEMVVPEPAVQSPDRNETLHCTTLGSDEANVELVLPSLERDLKLQSSFSVSDEVSPELDMLSFARNETLGNISGFEEVNSGPTVPSVDRNYSVLCNIIAGSNEESPELVIPSSTREGTLKCEASFRLDFGINAKSADLDCNSSRKHDPTNDSSCNVGYRSFCCSNEPTDSNRGALSVRKKESSFVCDICKQTFRHHSSYSRHRSTCGQEKPFYCNQCAKAFKRRDSLNRHMISCQRKVMRTLQCSSCGSEFQKNWLLQRHLKSCIVKTHRVNPDDNVKQISIKENESLRHNGQCQGEGISDEIENTYASMIHLDCAVEVKIESVD